MVRYAVIDPQSVQFVHVAPTCVWALKILFGLTNEATGYRPHGLAKRQDAEDLAIDFETPRP